MFSFNFLFLIHVCAIVSISGPTFLLIRIKVSLPQCKKIIRLNTNQLLLFHSHDLGLALSLIWMQLQGEGLLQQCQGGLSAMCSCIFVPFNYVFLNTDFSDSSGKKNRTSLKIIFAIVTKLHGHSILLIPCYSFPLYLMMPPELIWITMLPTHIMNCFCPILYLQEESYL